VLVSDTIKHFLLTGMYSGKEVQARGWTRVWIGGHGLEQPFPNGGSYSNSFQAGQQPVMPGWPTALTSISKISIHEQAKGFKGVSHKE
jgi:hypothetical protein